MQPAAQNDGIWSGWFVIIALMALATFISTATSFYLYYWRRIIIEQQSLFVPENLISLITQLLTQLNDLNQRSAQSTSELIALSESTHTLQAALTQRDHEISRLRQGYDSELFRRFVLRFLRTRVAVDDFLHHGETTPNTLNQISRLLDDALEECGVVRFRPEVGEDFRLAKGVADEPHVIESLDADADFKIVEVIEDGYRFAQATNSKVLIPAKVTISLARKAAEGVT